MLGPRHVQQSSASIRAVHRCGLGSLISKVWVLSLPFRTRFWRQHGLMFRGVFELSQAPSDHAL
eukprot:3641072-Amphidinium_carterae.1